MPFLRVGNSIGVVVDKLKCAISPQLRRRRVGCRHAFLVVVLTATLAACSGGNDNDGDNNKNNSVDTENSGNTAESMEPEIDLGVGTGSPADAGLAFFLNGRDMAAPESHWVCFSPDDIGSSQYWAVAFYEDATGRYVGRDAQQNISWTYNDPNVSFELSSRAGVYNVDVLERVTATEFDAMVSLSGTAGEMRKCLRFDELGNRI